MENKVVFGKWEAVCMLTILISTQVYVNFPRSMVESAGTAGWILSIYITLLAFIGFMILSKLFTPFEGKDLLDIVDGAMGSPGRIIVGSIIIAYLVLIISIVLREFGEDVKTIALSVSPISYVMLFFLTGMIAGAFAGLETLARICAIAVPIIMIGFYFIFIGVSPYFDIGNILPLLGNGINDIFIKGASRVSTYSALIVLFLIIPFIRTNKNFRAAGYTTLAITGFNFFISTFVYLSVYPYPIALENFLPVYQLARLINYSRFFQRVESLFMIIWVLSALINLSLSFFFIVYVFKKTFKLTYYRPLIIPFAILVFNISLLPPNLMKVIQLETSFFRNYIWIVTFILPLLVGLIARIRMKKERGCKP